VEHAARQLQDGRWISKMGDEEDVVHRDPESLSSNDYGQPRIFMERPLKQTSQKGKKRGVP
jgi:hypothetical protein